MEDWKPSLPTLSLSLTTYGGAEQAPVGGWEANRNLPSRTQTPSGWLFQSLPWLSARFLE